MPFFPRRKSNYRKRRAPMRKRAVGKRKSSVSVGVKSYVKRQIHLNMENKTKQVQLFNTFGSSLQDATLNVFPMLPYTGYMSLAQGVGSSDRVGNVCKVRKLMLNYTLNPLPYDATVNTTPKPMEILMILGYLKQSSGVIPQPGDISILFQNNNSATAPTGSLFDLISNYNSDVWTIVKSWRHKIGYANQSSIPNTNNFNFTNNDYKYNVVKKLDITRHVTKTLKFNDTSSNVQGRNLFLMYYAINCDGTVPAQSQINCQIYGHVQLDFEDA